MSTAESGYTDLQILRGFDPDEYPYCLARGAKGLLLIDIKLNCSLSLLKLEETFDPHYSLREHHPWFQSRLVQVSIQDSDIFNTQTEAAGRY